VSVDDDAPIRRLADLPKVDRLLARPELAMWARAPAARAVRAAMDAARAAVAGGATTTRAEILADAARRARDAAAPALRPVINATGVIVHTNLGRAPWSDAARRAVDEVTRGWCDLELDLATGRRGERAPRLTERLCALTGAEAALVVNNAAAAVLLALTALAAGREVIASRGEVVEIGGSFRVPDIVTACGARLVEVGTTNRTRVADFSAAIGPNTGALLSVHPSNFRVVGFTEAPDRRGLVALARARGLPFVFDLGSGSLDGVADEPGVRAAVADGVDLVVFSGDKLLGGPQAGVIVGRADWVSLLRRHPMYRALRVDKAILAALDATVRGWLGEEPPPVAVMMALTPEALRARAARWVDALGAGFAVVDALGRAGGGALPEHDLPSAAVRGFVGAASEAVAALRASTPPVLARVEDGAVLLDLRTVPEDQDGVVVEVLRAVASMLAVRPRAR
jgi:L-seryl-tRNA(Ser) seleniumtransferase